MSTESRPLSKTKEYKEEEIPASVVIATSSRYKLLEELLKSLQNQTFQNFEVILVCIKVDKQLRELALRYGTKLLEDRGRGLCFARNLGIREAKGEIVVFLDDDVFLDKEYLEFVVEDFASNPNFGGVGGVTISIQRNHQHTDRVLNKVLKLFNREKRFKFKNKVSYLSGSNMAFRRDILLRVGGSDEDFYGPSAGEDADLCLRVAKKGFLLQLDPKAKAYHRSNYEKRILTHHRKDPDFFLALADNQTYWRVKNSVLKGSGWCVYLLYHFLISLYWMLATRNIRVAIAYLKGILKGRLRGARAKVGIETVEK